MPQFEPSSAPSAEYLAGYLSYPGKRIDYPNKPGNAEQRWLNGWYKAKLEAESGSYIVEFD